MSNPKYSAEELIKETAKNLFFVQGRFHATTQEIADAAGVNRTLINYYFRSRDNLITIIFEEAKKVVQEKSKIINSTEYSFKEKLGLYIDACIENSIKYPYLETYIVTQMNNGTCPQNKEEDHQVRHQLYKSLEEEMEKGNIEKMEPIQFLLNLISLLSFPSAIRPLLIQNLEMSSAEFDRLIAQRKKIIMNMLFKK